MAKTEESQIGSEEKRSGRLVGAAETSKELSEWLHQSKTASTWWCDPRPGLGWVEMAVGLPEGPSYPGHSPHRFVQSF